MHPIFCRIGNFPIHTYGVMMALGLLSAVVVWHLLGKRLGKPPGYGSDVGVWLMVSGLLGARIAFVAANWELLYADQPWSALRIDQGGLIFYGGLIGSLVGMSLFAYLRHEKWLQTADLVITPIPLAHALGRVGCFLNGCCFGTAHTGLFSYDLNGTYRHPVQLYEALLNAIVFVVLYRWYGRRTFRGQIFAGYLLLYPIVRFCIEHWRGDERLMVGPLNTAQWVSVGLFSAGIVLYAVCRKLNREPSRAVPADAPDDSD